MAVVAHGGVAAANGAEVHLAVGAAPLAVAGVAIFAVAPFLARRGPPLERRRLLSVPAEVARATAAAVAAIAAPTVRGAAGRKRGLPFGTT